MTTGSLTSERETLKAPLVKAKIVKLPELLSGMVSYRGFVTGKGRGLGIHFPPKCHTEA
jgi:hypothetical protein